MPAPTLRNTLQRLVLVLAGSAGCASTSDQIAERFAKEQGCGILAVKVTESSSQDYVGAPSPDDKYRSRRDLEPPK